MGQTTHVRKKLGDRKDRRVYVSLFSKITVYKGMCSIQLLDVDGSTVSYHRITE